MPGLCIFIPGFAGTDLVASFPGWDYGYKVWIGAGTLAMGGYRALDLDAHMLESIGVSITTGGVVEPVYGDFLAWLTKRTDALDTFPYDWRLPLAMHVPSLVARIRSGISSHGNVTIIGHSNGGKLGALACNALTADEQHAVTRLVTIGTPWHGSYRAPQSLLGDSLSVRILAGLASVARFTLPMWELHRVQLALSSLPGLYELFPNDYLQSVQAVVGNQSVWNAAAYVNGGCPVNAVKLAAAYLVAVAGVRLTPLVPHTLIHGIGRACPGPFGIGPTLPDSYLAEQFDGDGIVPTESAIVAFDGPQDVIAVSGSHDRLCSASGTLTALAPLL